MVERVWIAVIPRIALIILAVGCATPQPADGLRPLPLVMTRDNFTRQVESLQPWLQWEAFPRPADLKADDGGELRSARNVTYELRIWRAEGEPGDSRVFPLVRAYERKGLTQPEHVVEEPLVPVTQYVWTVRARFDLGAESRVTQWSVLLPTNRHKELPARHDATIPSRGYYRFMTPGS